MAMRGKQRTPGEVCADCGAPDPGWASINHGVLICDECCSVHRSLGRHISQVRPLHNGPPTPRNLLEMVQTLVSSGANSIWEHSLLDPSQVKSGKRKPSPADPVHPTKSEFIRAKYQRLDFVHRLPTKDDDGVTTRDLSKQLHSSVRTVNVETCLRLLSLGAQSNFFHPDKGNTPLHVAAKAGQMLQAELLIVYGGDPGAFDVNGKTPLDHAKGEGHLDLAERLVECQYELTDRLAYYLCGRKPDHSIGQHFIVPEMADSSLDRSELAKAAKTKLQALPNHLFEELAMDVYDEVDRRELDSVWLTTQNHSTIVNDKSVIPFLPVNPEFSSTRNQGRQKLARFNAREFATLIIDILNDARRRSSHRSILRTDNIDIMAYRDPPPAPPPVKLQEPRPGVGKVPSTISDDEPLYDSVAGSDDEPDLEAQLNDAEQDGSPNTNRRTVSMASSDLSDGPITIEEYLEVKKAHASAEAKIQQISTMNKNMTQEISLLQSMVQKLMQENSQLRASLVNRPDEAPAISNGHESPQTVEPAIPNTSGKSPRTFGRPQSMFEPRVQQRQNPWPEEGEKIPSTEDLLAGLPSTVGTQLPGVQSTSTESHAVIKRSVRQTGTLTKVEERTSQCDSDYDNTTMQTQEDIIQTVQESLIQNQSPTRKDHHDVSSSSGVGDALTEKLPRQEDIIRQTEQITRKKKKVPTAAQERKHDSFIPCSENIHTAVKEMADLFPEMPSSESVRMSLKLLLTSASRLLGECQSVLTSEQISSTDYQLVTQQVITTSYDIAKAAKQLVTLFQ